MRRLLFILVCIMMFVLLKAEANTVVSFPFNNSLSSFSVNDSSLLKDKKFNIYVNQGVLYIKYSKPSELLNGEVIIYNLLGQEVVRKKLEAIQLNQVSIPIQNTCYLIRINYSGKIHTQKVIVR